MSVAHTSARALAMAALALSIGVGSIGAEEAAPPTPRSSATTLPFHDLAQASATLVVRDGGHIELRLQVPWAEVLFNAGTPGETAASLRGASAAQSSIKDFLVLLTSEPAERFARRVAMVQRDIERNTKVTVDVGTPVTLTHWQWPGAEELRDALRRELMSRLATPGEFEHASRLPVVAERAANREIASVRVQLPPVLGPVLLTAYRPSEQWLVPGTPSAPIGVRRAPPR